MKRNLTQLAKELAAELLKQDQHERTGSSVIAYYQPRNGTPRRVVRVIDNAGDPYQALAEAATAAPSDADALIVTATGWAAPADDDGNHNGPPSLDPNRQRCAVVVARTLTRKQPATISAVQLAGEAEPMTNADGHGPLADALNKTARAITKRR